jgi:hypothetical protein
MGGGEEGGLSLYKGNHRTKTHEQPPVSHAAKTGIKKIPWKYANIILYSFCSVCWFTNRKRRFKLFKMGKIDFLKIFYKGMHVFFILVLRTMRSSKI